MKAVKCVLGMLGASVLLAACNNVDFKKTASGVPYKLFSKGCWTKNGASKNSFSHKKSPSLGRMDYKVRE